MRYLRHQNLVIIIYCAVMASLSIVLDKFLQIPIGIYKFTVYGLPLMYVGIMFGKKAGFLCGIVSGIVLQLTSEYGITVTSIFWALAPVAWGGVAGIFSDIFKNNLNPYKIVLTVVICSISALLLNTIAMLMECVLMNSEYYTLATIFTGLITRIISCFILCFVYSLVLIPLYYGTKYVIESNQRQFDETIEDEIEDVLSSKEEKNNNNENQE